MRNSITAHLRQLRDEDAPRMLEWMQDKSVVEHLHADFQHKTLQDCRQFILASRQEGGQDLHLAIADTADAYKGTVSLKNIDPQTGTAEFGICMHPSGMGQGLAKAAMSEILLYGRQSLGLKAVYWCVSVHNLRANRFYQKNGYKTTDAVPLQIKDRYRDLPPKELVWYCAPQVQDADE